MRLGAVTLLATALAAATAATATASPARTHKLRAVEVRWVTPVVKLWNTMNQRLQMVQKQALADGALIIGTRANYELTKTLAMFVDCRRALAQAKKAPTQRLKPVAVTMTSACKQLRLGALDYGRAIGDIRKNKPKAATKKFRTGFTKLKRGSDLIAKAHKQLLAVGGKSLFAA